MALSIPESTLRAIVSTGMALVLHLLAETGQNDH
mgnify:CR=1 FL=1